MSVKKFSVAEFADIATTIKNSPLRKYFYTAEEEGLMARLNHYPPLETQRDKDILCWVERLHIANALAYHYQYSDTDTIIIKRLNEKDLEGKLLPEKELYQQLRSLRYNLYTNNGRVFLGGNDLARLTRFIDILRDDIELKQAEVKQ